MGRQPSGGPSPQLSVRVTRELKRGLTALADEDKRKLSGYVVKVLEEHVEAHRAQIKDYLLRKAAAVERAADAPPQSKARRSRATP